MTKDEANAAPKRRKTEGLLRVLLVAIAFLVVLFLAGYAAQALYLTFGKKKSRLQPLVEEIQKDIKAVNDQKAKTGWEVNEAEVEVNFVVTASNETSADIKTATETVGAEQENAGRLVLRLHPVGAAADTQPIPISGELTDSMIEKHSTLKSKTSPKDKKGH
ncbi:MAG TPA: hypothetical protein VMF66_14860 [Candidatus Acidoferrum sp.]|nr:hypothetical protein [Candidatus Acidoferrum sp.]